MFAEAEFAVDQYLLGGGTVVACLDAFSVAAQRTAGGGEDGRAHTCGHRKLLGGGGTELIY